MSRATCRGQRSHVVSLAGQCGNSAVFRRLRGSTRLLVPQILPIWRFMMMCRDGAAVGRHVGLIPVVPYDFASHVDDLTWSGHTRHWFLLLVASYLDIPARMAFRRLKHRRMAGGDGFDMLRAEDQPHSPFARHSPQRALLTGWSLLITCSVLHVIRDGRHGLGVDMRLVRPVCSCSQCGDDNGRGGLTHISCACACSSSTRFSFGRAWPSGCDEQSGPDEDRGPADFPLGARPRHRRRSSLSPVGLVRLGAVYDKTIKSGVASRASHRVQ
jgi:hypothetical protein